MIKELARGLASEMGIQLSDVSIVNGVTVGCLDMHLLHLQSGGHMVNTLIYQMDMDSLQAGCIPESLTDKILFALSRLKLLLES